MTNIEYNKYNPSLSLKENSEILGCSVSALKKYLRKAEVDVGYDTAFSRWKKINDYKKSHPSYSLRKKSQKLGFSINTIRKYEAMSEEALNVSFRDTEKVSRFDIRNKNAIKSVSSNQKDILIWIMNLYNGGNPFEADLTSSLLKFYKHVPCPDNLFDKYPQLPQVKDLIEADALPDASFSSIIYDLPFIVSVGAMSMIKERFTFFDTVEELYQANDEMLNRAYRLLKAEGLLVVKTMDINHAGKQYWVSDYVLRNAQDKGLELLDKFILTSHLRLFSKTREQHMARKYHSYFFVFRKH